MRTSNSIRLRIMLVTTVVLVCAAIASPALAQGRDGKLTRPMLIDSVNAEAGTITLMGTRYRVTESSRILDEEGNRIRLRDLRPRNGDDLGDMVSVETRDGNRSEPEVRELKIVPVLMP